MFKSFLFEFYNLNHIFIKYIEINYNTSLMYFQSNLVGFLNADLVSLIIFNICNNIHNNKYTICVPILKIINKNFNP